MPGEKEEEHGKRNECQACDASKCETDVDNAIREAPCMAARRSSRSLLCQFRAWILRASESDNEGSKSTLGHGRLTVLEFSVVRCNEGLGDGSLLSRFVFGQKKLGMLA